MDKTNTGLNGNPSERAIRYLNTANINVKDHPEVMEGNHVYYSIVDNDNDDKIDEALPYKNVSGTILKGYPTVSSNDYEALPDLSMYERPPDYFISDEPSQYVVGTNSVTIDSTVGKVLSDDEQVYKDPGHNKERIYSWFEEKKFLKLKRSDIK